MHAQFGLILKHFAAHVTHVVTGYSAMADMTLKAQGVGEDLAALATSKFLYCGIVCSHMANVVLLANNDFAAYFASVRHFVMNRVHVLFEVVCTLKLFITLIAGIVYSLLGVCFHVLLQVNHVFVAHITMLTLAFMIKQVALVSP